jgi:hypothetical protein
MGRSYEYRRYAKHCLELASTLQDPKGGPPCCRWRRCGCAWHSAMWRRKHPISLIGESSPERPPRRLSPRPAPFPPTVYGAARSWLHGPGGGIPPQTAGIALWVPCREQPGIRRPVPECIPGYSDGTLAPTSVVTRSFWTSSHLGREEAAEVQVRHFAHVPESLRSKWRFGRAIGKGWETETRSPPCCALPRSIRRRFLPTPGGRGCGSGRGGSG